MKILVEFYAGTDAFQKDANFKHASGYRLLEFQITQVTSVVCIVAVYESL